MTNPTPHGQVPEALIDLIDAYAETHHRCGGVYNAKTEAARKAVIEALSGVQALSAAPATPTAEQPIGEVVVTKDEDGQIVAVTRQDDEGRILSVIATSDPAKQQTHPGAVYAELHEPDSTTVGLGAVWNRHSMRDFADRTHALRQAVIAPELQAEARRRYDAAMEQAAPKAAPGEPPGIQALMCVISSLRDTAHFSDEEGDVTDDLRTLRDWAYAQTAAFQPSPKAALGVGNSGFDYKTAADFLNGKTVSDEAVRKFVAASRWAHDERAALSATLLAMHGVLTSREAEIALLKKALMEAEAAPQQEPAFWTRQRFGEEREFCEAPFTTDWTPLYTAPKQEAQEPALFVSAKQLASLADPSHATAGSYLPARKTRAGLFTMALYTAPQPAPDCHHRPPCDECAALAAQGGKDA